MREDFLHYIWKYQNLKPIELIGTNNEKITVKSVGLYNSDAGPDFLNSRILINDTEWAGNVEIHLKSSDWYAHKHQKDADYETVILHVVYEDDQAILRKDGSPIPTLVIKPYLPDKSFSNYQTLLSQLDWLACKASLANIDQFTINNWLDCLLVERLEKKTTLIENTLIQLKGDWESVFYVLLAKYFGFKVNSEAFIQLVSNIPMNIYAKMDNQFQIEALLFGQAALLNREFKDNYPNQLKKEYQFLKAKYQLFEMSESSWKFLRLRPANFPTIRIAQFAQLIFQQKNLFSKIIEIEKIESLYNILQTEANTYWKTHFVFDKESQANKFVKMGKSSLDILIINAVVPTLFAYGKSVDNDKYCNRAIEFLEKIKAEKNSIINHFKQFGLYAASAYESQALIELKNNFCQQKNCLNCAIGNKVLTFHI